MKTKKLFCILLISISCTSKPTNFAQYFNAGIHACQEKNYETAITNFKQAVKIDPHSLNARYNLASMLKQNGDIYEAIEHYQYVLSKTPDHLSSHAGFGQSCLAAGNYEEGWQALEFWRLGSLHPYTSEIKQYIACGYSLSGKKVFLQAEGGLGDTFMFLRYAQILHEKGAKVFFRPINEKQVHLLQLQPYIQVIPPNEKIPPFNFQMHTTSLPYVFGTTLATIPAPSSYITCDETLVTHWKEKLSHDKNFKIGICWRGETYNEEQKFMPLEYYAQLAEIPGITLYSLQKQHGLEQLDTLKNKTIIKTFDETFDQVPFLDTAAVMKNLDLIITTDTSVAHLAGALGVPTWVILHYPAEWRWMLDRSDSPWYPSMRLFRQEKNGDWQNLCMHLAAILKKRVNKA